MKVALILAGGKGTRLAQVRDDIPKAYDASSRQAHS